MPNSHPPAEPTGQNAPRAVVAHLTHVLPPLFVGRVYENGAPHVCGPWLLRLYHDQFDRDLDALLRAVVDQPFNDGSSRDDASAMWELPDETVIALPSSPPLLNAEAALEQCAWAYVFTRAASSIPDGPPADTLLVFYNSSVDPSGVYLTGFTGPGTSGGDTKPHFPRHSPPMWMFFAVLDLGQDAPEQAWLLDAPAGGVWRPASKARATLSGGDE